MTKSNIRQRISSRVRLLTPEVLAGKSAAICEAVSLAQEWSRARTVGFFAPLSSEPDVELLWAQIGSRTVCYPRVKGDGLVFLRVATPAALVETRWKLREPEFTDRAIIAPGDLDLLLVPGLAFTKDGHRLGRGGGCYDRLLADPTLRAMTFGICFAEQIVESLPMETHDQAVRRVFCG